MRKIDHFLNKKYPILIIEDPVEGGYTVSIPDLPGCITCCQQWQDIPAMIEDAKRAWMEELQKAGILEGHVKGEYMNNTEKTLILSNPAAGWCSFTLESEEGVFQASLSYLTDVMLDTLKACLTALQTGAAAVMYNRESEGTFLFVLSDYDVYILDENLESGMMRFENISVPEICEKVLDACDASPAAWINFANVNDQSESDYKKYEEAEAEEIKEVIKKICKLLE